jgi:hypothetical protein
VRRQHSGTWRPMLIMAAHCKLTQQRPQPKWQSQQPQPLVPLRDASQPASPCAPDSAHPPIWVCAGQDLGAQARHRPRLPRHLAPRRLDLLSSLVHILRRLGARRAGR